MSFSSLTNAQQVCAGEIQAVALTCEQFCSGRAMSELTRFTGSKKRKTEDKSLFCTWENSQEWEVISYLHSRYYRISALKVFSNVTGIDVTSHIKVLSFEYL